MGLVVVVLLERDHNNDTKILDVRTGMYMELDKSNE
jgi:hypothetical protein